MNLPITLFHRKLDWDHLWPNLRSGLIFVVLFGAAMLLTNHFTVQIENALSENAIAAVAFFFFSTIVAVLLPVMSNLALVPAFVLAWGPWWTAAVLLLGWTTGAALTFSLGRYARTAILHRFPSVHRHANIDRFIDPRHRLGSLILLRLTFPVDLLSYALGLFSARTTLTENIVSTAIGAMPFAVIFALLPTMSGVNQLIIFSACLLIFVGYAIWILDRRVES